MIADDLALLIANLSFEALPPEIVRITELAVLDWFGCAIAGKDAPATLRLLHVARALGGAEDASLISGGPRTSPVLAALVNGAAAHAVELDDGHKGALVHTGAPIISAAIAAAEQRRISGAALVTAIVAGYETAIRVGCAVGPSHYRLFHSTATCGVFGAAAAAARVFELDAQATAHALGLAGTQSSGLWASLEDGIMAKPFHPGKAAADGVLAAMLAREGFTASRAVFEHDRGFIRALAPEADPAVLRQPAPPYRMHELTVKLLPVCAQLHAALDAVLELRREARLELDDVADLEVRLSSVSYETVRRTQLSNSASAKFHVPFCAASCLRDGGLSMNSFAPERLRDSTLVSFMERVRTVRDPALDQPSKMPAIVTVRTRRGAVHRARVDDVRGDPSRPATRDEMLEKFHGLSAALPLARRDRIAQCALGLSRLPPGFDLFDMANS